MYEKCTQYSVIRYKQYCCADPYQVNRIHKFETFDYQPEDSKVKWGTSNQVRVYFTPFDCDHPSIYSYPSQIHFYRYTEYGVDIYNQLLVICCQLTSQLHLGIPRYLCKLLQTILGNKLWLHFRAFLPPFDLGPPLAGSLISDQPWFFPSPTHYEGTIGQEYGVPGRRHRCDRPG